MPSYEYRGQLLNIPENDTEYQGYFDAAREHRLVVKKCQDCGLLRGEPGPGCPLVHLFKVGVGRGYRKRDNL